MKSKIKPKQRHAGNFFLVLAHLGLSTFFMVTLLLSLLEVIKIDAGVQAAFLVVLTSITWMLSIRMSQGLSRMRINTSVMLGVALGFFLIVQGLPLFLEMSEAGRRALLITFMLSNMGAGFINNLWATWMLVQVQKSIQAQSSEEEVSKITFGVQPGTITPSVIERLSTKYMEAEDVGEATGEGQTTPVRRK
jgi:hypothetical protein